MRNVLLVGLYLFSRLLGGGSPIRLTPRKVAVGNMTGTVIWQGERQKEV